MSNDEALFPNLLEKFRRQPLIRARFELDGRWEVFCFCRWRLLGDAGTELLGVAHGEFNRHEEVVELGIELVIGDDIPRSAARLASELLKRDAKWLQPVVVALSRQRFQQPIELFCDRSATLKVVRKVREMLAAEAPNLYTRLVLRKLLDCHFPN